MGKYIIQVYWLCIKGIRSIERCINIFKIWCFHGGDYEWRLPGCDAV
jgi:hypothetical protein